MEEHKEHKDKKHKKIPMDNIVLGAAVLLGVVLLVTNIIAFNLRMDLEDLEAKEQERLRPGNIELTIIKNSRCVDCYNVDSIVGAIKAAKVNVTKENTVEFNSKEAKELISKHQIQKVPTVIVKGEIEKLSMDGLEKKTDVLVFTDVPAPYTAAGTGKIEGLVKVYYLKDSSCQKCAELEGLIEQLKGAGLKMSEQKTFEATSSEGKQLIGRYNLSLAPSLVLSKDAAAYPIIKEAWGQVGTIEQDGSFVLRAHYAPFKNLTTGEVKGIIDVIYLSDKSCTQCQDVTSHKTILTSPQSYGLKFSGEENVDISSERGQEILSKYNITLIPTIILSDDVAVYPSSASLRQFFSVEKDGSYVFRQPSAIGTYKDVSTGQVVSQQEQQQ